MDLEEYALEQAASKPPSRSRLWKWPSDIAIQAVYSNVGASITATWVEEKTGTAVSGDAILGYRRRYKNNPVFDDFFGVKNDD